MGGLSSLPRGPHRLFAGHCEAAPSCPSLRGREAAEANQADYAARDGRAAYFVAAPLLDCFALASLGLAMTEGRTAPRILYGRPGHRPVTVIARRRSRRSNPGGRRHEFRAGGVPYGPGRFWIASPARRAGSQ